MNPEKSLLINKLTLVVLSLILVCLVLLVIRAYERSPSLAAPEVAVAEEPVAEPAPAPAPPEPAPRIQPPPPRRAPVPSRVVVVPAPSPEPPAVEPATGDLAEPVVVFPGVNLPGGSTGRSGGPAGGTAPRPSAGEIFGTVSLLGTPPPEVPIDLGPNCGRLQSAPLTTRRYVVSSEGGLADVFVQVSRGLPAHFAPVEQTIFLDQKGCQFEPYVVGVQKDQKLLVRNFDPELHNLHLIPRENREHNIAQLAGGAPIQFSFPKAEMFMKLKCDVHPWMFAYVSVVNHPFFAVTDTNGFFRLPSELPAGRYVVTATHLKAGMLSQEFTIRSGEQRAVDFQFALPGAIRPQNQASTRE